MTTLVCGRTLYKLGVTMLKVEDTLENSLGVVDERIESMQKILEVPLFSDSPEIKKIHADMRACQEALIDIANTLTNDMDQNSVEQLETE